ncbi:hypothetical protein ACL9RI_25590 [Janthinobacterium sp. Mn2066]|uniref:hypothetical protein n=1 Tax=Janthinobacterium sp. Mn2066 TaxID=3395264 RepID=UPI003BE7D468
MRKFAVLVPFLLLAACGGGGNTAAESPPVVVAPPAPALKYPIPAGMWSAPNGVTPAQGNYVYLQSSAGDYIGRGASYLYTNSNTAFKLSSNGLGISLRVAGDQNWDGSFLLPSAATQLQTGYFSSLSRTPFTDTAVGGLDWSGEGRGCNQLTGWLIIDKITVADGVMNALDLRFEQYCDGNPAPLRGQIHWTKADDVASTAGPQAIPATLWKPDASFVPPWGNYVYLVNSNGGRPELQTSASTSIEVDVTRTAALSIAVGGFAGLRGDFVGMNSLSQLQPGYYADLQRYPFHNAVKGGMSWVGNGQGCNTLKGWFVVDQVSYVLGALTSIDLRFEQICDGAPTSLRGAIHWAK